MTDHVTSEPETTARATVQTVHALMHFSRVVRYRQSVVFACIGVALALGAAYYITATRYYQAKASLLVLQTGTDVNGTAMTPEGSRQGLMPTYEKLFTSAVVLEGALRKLAPEHRVDLQSAAPDNWPAMLRQNLTATTVRQTNIIEIGYKSKSPKASVAVVEAMLKSYLDFMDKTHKGTVGELIDMLTKDKVQIEEKLGAKQEEVLQARRRFGDLGIRADSKIVHPMVQRVVSLNDSLMKAQEKRLELQASLAAIQAAIRNGEDLQQHMLSLEGNVGREFMMNFLGFSTRDVTVQANLEKGRIEDEAELKTTLEHLGPRHPRVQELQARIAETRDYLDNYQAKVDARLAQVRDKQLGPMLAQMVQQRLSESWQHENSLRTTFERARTDAVNHTGDLERLQILEDDLKFLREFRDVLLNKIASIDLRQDAGDIRTAVVTEPRLPKSPVWPRLPLVGVVCLAAGIVFGLALVYVLDILDDRFRSPEEMRSQLGAPVLAMVRQMQELSGQGLESLHVHATPSAVESEAFRTLRTALAFSSEESERVAVSSAEPGDGKTTVLANLAVCFAQTGKRTLLIDADMRRPGLSGLFGLKGQLGLSDILVSHDDVAQIAQKLVRTTGMAGLDILPAGPRRPNPAEMLAGPRLPELLAWAESAYDQVLVDSPPALAATDASIIGRLVDGLVMVVQPKKNQRRLVMRAAESLTAVGVRLLGVVVNRISGDKSDSVYGYGSGYGYGYGYGYGNGYGYGEGESQEGNVVRVPRANEPRADLHADQSAAGVAVETIPIIEERRNAAAEQTGVADMRIVLPNPKCAPRKRAVEVVELASAPSGNDSRIQSDELDKPPVKQPPTEPNGRPPLVPRRVA